MIHRRQFLLGAAGILGALAAADNLISADAETRQPGASIPPGSTGLSIAHFDGSRLRTADRLEAGNAAFLGTTAKLTIAGFERRGKSLTAIDLHYRVPTASGKNWIPHLAWTRTTKPISSVARVPVTEEGIRFSVHHHGIEQLCTLTTGDKLGAVKLKQGTYVIAAGNPMWGLYYFEPSNTSFGPGRLLKRSPSGLNPVTFDYVTIHVEQA